jgi:hypothetical protein
MSGTTDVGKENEPISALRNPKAIPLHLVPFFFGNKYPMLF